MCKCGHPACIHCITRYSESITSPQRAESADLNAVGSVPIDRIVCERAESVDLNAVGSVPIDRIVCERAESVDLNAVVSVPIDRIVCEIHIQCSVRKE